MRYFTPRFFTVLAIAMSIVWLVPVIFIPFLSEVWATAVKPPGDVWSWAIVALTVGVALFNRSKINDFLLSVAHRRVDRYVMGCAPTLD